MCAAQIILKSSATAVIGPKHQFVNSNLVNPMLIAPLHLIILRKLKKRWRLGEGGGSFIRVLFSCVGECRTILCQQFSSLALKIAFKVGTYTLGWGFFFGSEWSWRTMAPRWLSPQFGWCPTVCVHITRALLTCWEQPVNHISRWMS